MLFKGFKSFLQKFESMAFDSSCSSLGIRIYLIENWIHLVRANSLESKFEYVPWGFESTSLSRPFWPFLKSRFKSIPLGFKSLSLGRLIGIGIRIHSIGIWISFFKFPSLHSLELRFESTSLFWLVLLLFDQLLNEFESYYQGFKFEHQKTCSKCSLVKFFKVYSY